MSDAGGRPIERLHLREQTTLRTLATIERTTLVRRQEDTLRIYHADVRAPGTENAEIPVALMERSQMTAVIIGPMQPHAIDALLDVAERRDQPADLALPATCCFMLPPNAVWISNKVRRDRLARAPARARRERIDDRRVVGLERDARHVERGQDAARLGRRQRVVADVGIDEFPIKVGDVGAQHASAVPLRDRARRSGGAGRARRARRGARPAGARRAASSSTACSAARSSTAHRPGPGARDARPAPVDMELAAAACAQVLRAHREAARSMGLADPVDEVITSAGARQQC